VTVPSWRNTDIAIEEDVIEEIARVFGYHNIPSELPPFTIAKPFHQSNIFFWEDRAKDAMKYWGFIETYTYSMVSEKLLTGSSEQTIELTNPLDNDHVFLRTTLIPSLQEVVQENRGREDIKIFELAHVYKKKTDDLPDEVKTLTAIWKGKGASFYTMKGFVEQLGNDFGIHDFDFDDLEHGLGARIFLDDKRKYLGTITILENNIISFELNFDELIKHATLKKYLLQLQNSRRLLKI